jgi:hypothetical protein
MENVISHVDSNIKEQKKQKGQFYTVNVDYILEGFESLPEDCNTIIEPFAGKGDLVKWVQTIDPESKFSIEKYDIDPKCEDCIKRDTLNDPPDYSNKFVLTNPPYLARNKNNDKKIYDKYNSNDLYKCFLLSLCDEDVEKRCAGGIVIIPAGFFFSPRDIDTYCRNKFLTMYKILKVKYFEETVFPDTPTTVVAIHFVRSESLLEAQEVLWNFLPNDSNKLFEMSKINDWIVGGEIYKVPTNRLIHIGRFVDGYELKTGEQLTFLTLNALDSGKADGKICLKYQKDSVYKAKESSRSFATLIVKGIVLTEEDLIVISKLFNQFLEKKRNEYNSLFLPQYRESKEYARKRIPFELAYNIINYLITYELNRTS